MSGASTSSLRGSFFELTASGAIAEDWVLEDELDHRRYRDELDRQKQALDAQLEAVRPAIEAAVSRATALRFLNEAPNGSPLPADARRLRFPCTLGVRVVTRHLEDVVPGGLIYELHLFLEDGTTDAAQALARACSSLLQLDGAALERAVAEHFREQVSTVPAGVRAVRRGPALALSDGTWTGETFTLSFREWDQSSLLIERPVGTPEDERERRAEAAAFRDEAHAQLIAVAPQWLATLEHATGRGVRLRRAPCPTSVREGDEVTLPCTLQFLRTTGGRDGRGAHEPVFLVELHVDDASPSQLEQLVADLTAVLRGEPAPGAVATQKPETAWNEDLASAIAGRPPDNEALSVYADWLASHGNPLAALAQHEPQTPPHDAMVMQWLEALSPTAAAHARDGRLEFGWNHGFVESLTLTALGLGQGSALLARLLEHPLTRFVRMVKVQARPHVMATANESEPSAAEVQVEFDDEGEPEPDPEPDGDEEEQPYGLVNELVKQLQSARPAHLQSLEVRGDDAPGLALDELFTAFPLLEELSLDHCLPVLSGPPDAARLRFLEVVDSSGVMVVNEEFTEHLQSLERLARSSFPSLQTLKLGFFWEPVNLRPLFEGIGVPRLHTLTLDELSDPAEQLGALLEGPLLSRLRRLGLHGVELQAAAVLLERRASAFVHLEALDLTGCTLPPRTRKVLLEAGVRLVEK